MHVLAAVLLALQEPGFPEQALKKLAADLPALVQAADADGNGTLDAAEFRAFQPAVRKAGEAILNQLDPTLLQKKAARDLKKYDKDADGRLSDEERKAQDEDARLKAIKDFDWDRDGKLSEREKTAMDWAREGDLAYQHRKHDTDMNGELSKEEISAQLGSLAGIKVKKPAAP
jgi:Ca2+-binding EF-hand superfamily protein